MNNEKRIFQVINIESKIGALVTVFKTNKMN